MLVIADFIKKKKNRWQFLIKSSLYFEINTGNPELEMTATESVVRVDLELRAPLNTNSENNNENKGKPSFEKIVVGKVRNP